MSILKRENKQLKTIANLEREVRIKYVIIKGVINAERETGNEAKEKATTIL